MSLRFLCTDFSLCSVHRIPPYSVFFKINYSCQLTVQRISSVLFIFAFKIYIHFVLLFFSIHTHTLPFINIYIGYSVRYYTYNIKARQDFSCRAFTKLDIKKNESNDHTNPIHMTRCHCTVLW